MKKLLAILLVLTMLLPMGFVAQADEADVKPFYMAQWGAVQDGLTHVYEMPFFWVNEGKLSNVLNAVWFGEANSYSIPVIAQKLKEKFDAYPDGARFINYCLAADALHAKAKDVVFVEDGIALSHEWLHAFLTEYKRIGGKLDGLIVDIEFEDLYATYIHSRYAGKDPLIYNKIVNNPIYAEKIRPELEARGFKFYDKVTPETPEIFGIHPKSGNEYAESRSIWDAVMRSYMNTMVTEACTPLWEYYPDAEMSDYQSKAMDPWLKELSDFGGLNAPGGNVTTAGTSSNENYYSTRPYRFFTDTTGAVQYKTIPGYNKAIYENKTFNYFLYEANIFKNTYLAADDNQVSFWIAYYMYNKGNKNSASLTPYYTEQILHMGLLNPQYFAGYIIQSEVGYEDDYQFCLAIVDDILEELTRMVGAADRQPINVETSWNSSFVLSGMTAGGKNIWRLTPDAALGDLESFIVADAADPTFKIGNETVTFAGGKIVEDGQIRGWDENQNEITNNTFGYWIETAADVAPAVAREANYHELYPAYGEDYEGYEIGTEYNYANALPATCWEAKKTGNGTATIVADPANADNKVLALTGNFAVKNVIMPKNITAGDSYAENQAWEVEVTIPSDMAAEAEVILLNGVNAKKKTDEGGFKIAGNKVYYSQSGEYLELSGVTLTSGSKYRFVRDMDFNNAEAQTCSYYVYDAEGKLLGSAKNIAISTLETPVAGISMSCTGISGEALLLDNYKIYPTHVGMDFELYDVSTGIKIKDTETAHSGSVAYRLSWLNSTNKEKTYTVMAAYYEGDKLVEEKVVKEVKMAANFEGVEHGVVEVAEGQSVRVYLRNDNPADDDDSDVPGASNKGSGVDPILFVLIGIVAVVIIAVVVALLLTGKKTKKGKKTAKKAPAKKAPAKKAPAKKAPVKKAEPEQDAE